MECRVCHGSGFIEQVAGHGDIRREVCPYCRIAELEADLEKLAEMWGIGQEPITIVGKVIDNILSKYRKEGE